ncbi:MAG: Na+/H+ antiporter subunit E [Candidatus Fermentibacteria bacterium]|nr:Na+/H+ antiporter subunit E [Candidatus Fermentibacteria bacterium]
MKNTKSAFIGMVILFAVWVMLTDFSPQEMIFGGATALLIIFLFHSKLAVLGDVKLNPRSLVYMVIYLFVFMWELLKSNIDVARRVISPKLPINPGIVKVKTRLKSPLGRAFLANSITLTPGTLTVEMKDEYFYIHWIDVTSENIEGATESIVSNFEKYLEIIFG